MGRMSHDYMNGMKLGETSSITITNDTGHGVYGPHSVSNQ
jgi:hypothetical protein